MDTYRERESRVCQRIQLTTSNHLFMRIYILRLSVACPSMSNLPEIVAVYTSLTCVYLHKLVLVK